MTERAFLALAEALRRDEGVARLVQRLALSDRFHFFLMICDTPRIAHAAIHVIGEEVPIEREEPVHLVRIDPYEAHEDMQAPIPFALLADQVLARLISPRCEDRAVDVITIVDGSRALPRDDEAWNMLFQRMNERRNTIAQEHEGSLVLVIPRRLEPTFAHAAPDFWSIRSFAAVVRTTAPVEAEERAMRLLAPLERAVDMRSEHAREAEEIHAEIQVAREELAKDPDNELAFEALVILLARLAQHEMAWGTLDGALRAAEEGVALERMWLERDPSRLERMRDLAASLNKVGDVHRERGELDLALASYEESLGLLRTLLGRGPKYVKWHDVWVSLNRVGDAHRERGELDLALASYDEGLTLARAQLQRDPAHVEWWRDLSVSLNRVGDVHRKRGELDLALASYEESLALARTLRERDPDRVPPLRDLAVSLNKVGDVHHKRGELDLALASYEEGLALARTLCERDPDHAQPLRDLSLSLGRIGEVHRARGDLDRARASYDEGLALARKLLERDPERVYFQRNLAVALSHQAQIAEASGDPVEALSRWREALAIVESLTQRQAPLPVWHEDAAECRAEIARLEAALSPQ